MGTNSRVVIIGVLLLVCATICMAYRTLPTLERATNDNTHSLADHSGNGAGTEAATGRDGYRDGRVYGDEKWKKGKGKKGRGDDDDDDDDDDDVCRRGRGDDDDDDGGCDEDGGGKCKGWGGGGYRKSSYSISAP